MGPELLDAGFTQAARDGRVLLLNSHHDVDLHRRRRILPWAKFLRLSTLIRREKEVGGLYFWRKVRLVRG